MPPKKLAAQFLEKAEAMRAAAIAAAVEQRVEQERHREELAERDAALLHTALDVQHALGLAAHQHALDKAQTLAEAARTLIHARQQPQHPPHPASCVG